MAGIAGFWSYTHDDDQHEGGRITQLAEDIRAEFEMLTGESLQIFVDRDSLEWGDAWQSRIDAALRETTFFFPVVTPRYFTSDSCRAELFKFAGYARALHATELLMPLYYVDVADFGTHSPDEAVALIANSQYRDWREQRFLPASSVEYRKAVNEAAKAIASKAASTALGTGTEAASTLMAESSEEDLTLVNDEPGYLDLVAVFETEMPGVADKLASYSAAMEDATAAMEASGLRVAEADAAGKPFAYRVVLAREMAQSLQEPAERMWKYAAEVFDGLGRVDPGVRAIILAAEEQQPTGDELEAVCSFFDEIRQAARRTTEMATHARTAEQAMEGTAKLSKDLRPVIGKIRGAARRIADGEAIVSGWREAVEASSLPCGGPTAEPSA